MKTSTCITCRTKLDSVPGCSACARRRVFVAGLDMADLVFEDKMSVGAALAVVSERYKLTGDDLCGVNAEWDEIQDEVRSIDWEHGDDYVALEYREMRDGASPAQ